MPSDPWRHAHHAFAVTSPRPGSERAIVNMMRALREYVLAYGDEYPGSKLADDHVLGPAWLDAARALLTLLNGPIGRRLDVGTLDSELRKAAMVGGYKEEL